MSRSQAETRSSRDGRRDWPAARERERREQPGGDGQVGLDGGEIQEGDDRAQAEPDLRADQQRPEHGERAQVAPPAGAPERDDRGGDDQRRHGDGGEAMQRLDEHGGVRVRPERAPAERHVGAGEGGARVTDQTPEHHLEIDRHRRDQRQPRQGRRRRRHRGVDRGGPGAHGHVEDGEEEEQRRGGVRGRDRRRQAKLDGDSAQQAPARRPAPPPASRRGEAAAARASSRAPA